ncbi:MAG: nucleotidyltransferase domain-containing protein [Verrucomicrobiota bacterium]
MPPPSATHVASAVPEVSPAQAAALAETRLREHIGRLPAGWRVVLFGSRATGRHLRRSDFDLAVFPPPGADPWALLKLREAIEDDGRIIYAVDIVDMRDASPELMAEVVREGVVWKN